jgi:hypothetical protein
MGSELRHVVRSLRRAPGFFAASVLLLALAIAPTVGVFRCRDHIGAGGSDPENVQ